jgi:hypothetical protein
MTSGRGVRVACLGSMFGSPPKAPSSRHKLDAAAAEIVALKGVVTSLQAKAGGDKKPETK